MKNLRYTYKHILRLRSQQIFRKTNPANIVYVIKLRGKRMCKKTRSCIFQTEEGIQPPGAKRVSSWYNQNPNSFRGRWINFPPLLKNYLACLDKIIVQTEEGIQPPGAKRAPSITRTQTAFGGDRSISLLLRR